MPVTSYKTHNYCASERKWILKIKSPGIYCPSCNIRIRKKSRYYSINKCDGAY